MILNDFSNHLRKLVNGDIEFNGRAATIGKPSEFLSKCGADSSHDITITKKVITKAMRTETRDENGKLIGNTGHGLSFEMIVFSLQELDYPPLVFKGSSTNSLLVVTNIIDQRNRNIVIAIELNKCEGFNQVNSIRSIYGRDHFSLFVEKNFNEGNLIGVNKKKADDLLRSIGKSYPKENTFISCD